MRRSALPFGAHWYSGLTDPLGLHDLAWLQADGSPLQGNAWHDEQSRTLGCLIGKPGCAKAPLLLLVNASHEACNFLLPAGVWQALLDSTHPRGHALWHGQGETALQMGSHSVWLLAAAGANVK